MLESTGNWFMSKGQKDGLKADIDIFEEHWTEAAESFYADVSS